VATGTQPTREDREGTLADVDGGEGICFYEAGTWGPEAADKLIEHDGRRWRRL
jgi:glucose-6-phosphate 1-dehydrogenase